MPGTISGTYALFIEELNVQLAGLSTTILSWVRA